MSDKKTNPWVSLHISVDSKDLSERLVIELFDDVSPAAFIKLFAGGFNPADHQIVFHYETIAEVNDFSKQVERKHGECKAYIWEQTNDAPIFSSLNKRNNASFFDIVFTDMPFINRSHAVYGKIVKGMRTLKEIQSGQRAKIEYFAELSLSEDEKKYAKGEKEKTGKNNESNIFSSCTPNVSGGPPSSLATHSKQPLQFSTSGSPFKNFFAPKTDLTSSASATTVNAKPSFSFSNSSSPSANTGSLFSSYSSSPSANTGSIFNTSSPFDTASPFSNSSPFGTTSATSTFPSGVRSRRGSVAKVENGERS